MIDTRPSDRNFGSEAQARAAISSAFPDLGPYEIERLAFLVLMGAAAAAQADLVAIMAKVKAINAAKDTMRDRPGAKAATGAPVASWREDARGRVSGLIKAFGQED